MSRRDPLDVEWWESPDGGFDWDLYAVPLGVIAMTVILAVAYVLGAVR